MLAPKLRFEEFTDSWHKNTLGSLFEITSGTTPLRSNDKYYNKGSISWVKTTDLNNSFIHTTEEKITEIAINELSALKILPIGTILLAMYGGFNQIGRTGCLSISATCNQALSAIKPNTNFIPYFIISYLNYHVGNWKNIAASSRKDPNITKKDVEQFEIVYPSLLEQSKIADFLTILDTRINQQEKQCQLLEQYKKGIMQQIFSQQLRFKDDNAKNFPEWKEKKLGNISDITTGKLDANAMCKNGRYRFFTCAKTSYLIDNYAFDTEALLISGNGAYVGYIHYFNGKFNAYQRTYVLDKFKENIIFIKFYLETFLRIRITKEKKEGNTPYIVMSTLSDMTIRLPCLKEQTKIANFLTAIDDKINLAKAQLEQLNIYKKGLLQQLFI